MLIGAVRALFNSTIPPAARQTQFIGRFGGVLLAALTAALISGPNLEVLKHGGFSPLVFIPYLCLLGGEVYARVISERKIEASGVRLVRLSSKDTEAIEARNAELIAKAYTPFITSYPGDRSKLTPETAEKAFQEFTTAIPARLEMLSRVLGAQPEHSPPGFAESVTQLAPMQKERDPSETKKRSFEPQLDGQSLALCHDLGMLMAQTLLERNPELRWRLCPIKKDPQVFQHPVITGDKAFEDMRPAAVVKGIVIKIMSGEEPDDIALRTYFEWEQSLLGKSAASDEINRLVATSTNV